jgi:hypothetical protein
VYGLKFSSFGCAEGLALGAAKLNVPFVGGLKIIFKKCVVKKNIGSVSVSV